MSTTRRLRVPRTGFRNEPVGALGSDNRYLHPGRKTTMKIDSRWYAFLWAPYDCYEFQWGNVIYAVVMELIFSVLLGWFVNLAKNAATGASLLVDGAFIGLVSAAVIYISWTWSTDLHLKRHLNWVISVAYVFTGQLGVIPMFFYIGIQFGGAAIAGAILSGLAAGSVPLPTAATGTVFALEFLGGFLIALACIHNDTLEEVDENPNSDDMSSKRETERENRFRTGNALALTVLLTTAVLYQYQHYSFGNVIYFAGGVSTGDWNPGATTFNDAAVFLGAPLVGAVTAGVISLIASYIVIMTPDKGVREWDGQCDPDNRKQMVRPTGGRRRQSEPMSATDATNATDAGGNTDTLALNAIYRH